MMSNEWRKKSRSDDSNARIRWKILARTLGGGGATAAAAAAAAEEEEEMSVRRFTSFGLLKANLVERSCDHDWYEYSAVLEEETFSVEIRRIRKNFTATELIGFNNTGNVCVWPSEECLGYYLLKNRMICRNRKVLELGGGMSCLAGLLAAKYCNPSSVYLTDGNATSVENVRCILERSGWAAGVSVSVSVSCALVRWAGGGSDSTPRGDSDQNWNPGTYDVILSADCLFFEESRSDLVETIYARLSEEGVALLMAPRRGDTFQRFADAAVKRGFIARQSERYDKELWSRHLELLEALGERYRADIHYPLLLELTKQKKMPPG